uniref:Uncharacterized protein n=1 Tax=Stegastes partitus TaxID=144197 RepID=A0A3B5AK01_9TELE
LNEPGTMEESQPPKHDAVTWFKKSQLESVIGNGVVPEWFHGIISRKSGWVVQPAEEKENDALFQPSESAFT